MNIKWHGTQFVPSVSNGFPIDSFLCLDVRKVIDTYIRRNNDNNGSDQGDTGQRLFCDG